ncbi:MAG: hypothetical protein CTY18_11930 [Methylomonas sp.]|nr:MAG: hypothetical protein CTY24_11165 [Methylobacter sp.]PPD31876.1 MAG: hypothetical protein CTY18_11930 [Methylomonas sp.]
MKADNPFDRKLNAHQGRIPISHVDGLTSVTDTLDFAWAAAQTVFEEAATPEHALKICELMLLCIHRNQDIQRKQLSTDNE